MKKLIILIFVALLCNHVIADDDSYDTAHKLATCSGNFEITAELFTFFGGGQAQVTGVKEKSNGWLLASVVFFMADGFNAEGARSSAQGVKATSKSYWMSRLESSQNQAYSDEENMDALFKVMEEIGELNVNECMVYDKLVEEAIKTWRMANSS